MEKISSFFKDTKPSGQLVGWCLLLLLGFIFSAGLQLLVPTSEYHTATDIRIELLLQGVCQLLTFMVPALLFAMLFNGRPKQYLRIDLRGRKWLLGLLAVLVMLLMTPLCDRLTVWNQGFSYGPLEQSFRSVAEQSQDAAERLLSLSGTGDLLLQLLVVALVPAVCEELFFRGCLQQVLCRQMRSPHLAIVVTALVFAVAHGDAYGFLPRLLLGLLLGYMFYYSGSIIVNICAHFFNNAVVVVLFWLYHRGSLAMPPTEPLNMPWFWIAMSTIGALLLGYQYWVKNGQNEV